MRKWEWEGGIESNFLKNSIGIGNEFFIQETMEEFRGNNGMQRKSG